MVRPGIRENGTGPLTPEMIAILVVGAALAGRVWQSHRALRDALSAGLREAKEDRERLRTDMNAGLREAKEDREQLRGDLNVRMDRIDERMTQLDGRIDGIHAVLREQGERLSRIEGMLHLHLGRNEGLAPPPVAAE